MSFAARPSGLSRSQSRNRWFIDHCLMPAAGQRQNAPGQTWSQPRTGTGATAVIPAPDDLRTEITANAAMMHSAPAIKKAGR
jgi:hypothetical protein